MISNYKKAYTVQKHDAKRRDIKFNLTFAEWMKIWTDSGHLSERGRRRGQYVMSRHGDTGPYSVDNVSIKKTEDNIKEFVVTDDMRNKMSQINTGAGNPMFGRSGKKHPLYGVTGKEAPRFGKSHSSTTKHKISESLKGEKHWRYGVRKWRIKPADEIFRIKII